jgi:uncharacterized protein
MVVGVCTIELSLPAPQSLKDKRGALKPLIAQMRREFNVAVAEVDRQDLWQRATIVVATVSNDAGYAHGLLEKVIGWIERTQPQAFVSDWHVEML